MYSIWGIRTRLGNCLIKSCTLAHFLWKSRSTFIKKIEVCLIKNADHAFVVVNRDVMTNIDKPDTWQYKNTRIIDLWGSCGDSYSIYKSCTILIKI